MLKVVILFITLISLNLLSLSHAETISISVNDSIDNSKQGIIRPVRGVSMSRVKQDFGQADNISVTVGNPPISIWTYADFSVYFEAETVIHSVVNNR